MENILHISAVYDAFSNTHSNIAFQNEVSWGGTSSYTINILSKEHEQESWVKGSYSGASCKCNLPTSEKYIHPSVISHRSCLLRNDPCRCMFKYYDFTIQTLHRGKESHIACRSTLEVKLVCTNMMMLRCSHLHSSCLLTHTYTRSSIMYVWSTCLNFPA